MWTPDNHKEQPLEIPVSETVVLRELMLADSLELFELIAASGDHLAQFGDTTARKYKTLESVEELYRQKDPGTRRFGIRDKGELVGFIKFGHFNDQFGEIGYWLGKDYEGHGYMTDAVQTLAEHATRVWGYTEAVAITNSENTASQRVLKRAGFIFLGEQPSQPPSNLYSYSEPPVVSVKKTVLPRDELTIFDLKTDAGCLQATLDPASRWFGIANVDVEPLYRRHGIGKVLLRKALEVAQDNDAPLIYAAITSREAIDAFRTVFGHKAIGVSIEGSYAPYEEPGHADAKAGLWIPVPAKRRTVPSS